MDKEKEIKTGIDESKVNMDISDKEMFKDTDAIKEKRTKQAQSGDPTYNPREYKEQFYFQDDGSLWVCINNIWQRFDPVSSNVKVRASKSGEQTLGSGWEKVTFTVEDWDTGSNWNPLNSTFTAPVNGYYAVYCQWMIPVSTANVEYFMAFRINGHATSLTLRRVGYADQLFVDHSDTVYMLKDQYLEFYSLGNSSYKITDTSPTSYVTIYKI